MPFGASNLFMSFVYAENFLLFFQYLLRSFLNNNFSYKSTKFMTIFVVCLFACRYVCACVWVCSPELQWKIAVHTHTHTYMYAKQSDCIKRNIRFYRKIRATMTTIECYKHTLWTDCCRIANNKTMWKHGKMESIFQKKKKQKPTDRGKWSVMLTKKK